MDTTTYTSRKAELCAAIFALVEQFTLETGRHVLTIRLNPVEITNLGEETSRYIYGVLDNIECNEIEAVQLELEQE